MSIFNRIARRNSFFCFILFGILTFIFNSAFADTNMSSIKHIVMFGDSLSDDGNLYRSLFHFIPKSPPYFAGRFSNGPTWIEDLAAYYKEKNQIDYENYAVGGATTILHMPSLTFIAPSNLDWEMFLYFSQHILPIKKTDTLFAIWIGGNDYLFDTTDDPDVLTTHVVDQIKSEINRLIWHNAKNILLLNLPDLGKIPYAATSNNAERLHYLAVAHNQKLSNMLDDLKISHPDVSFIFIDMYNIFKTLKQDVSIFDEKYHVKIQDTAHACWGGNVFLRPLNKLNLQQNIKQELIAKNSMLDINKASEQITYSPDLYETYLLGERYKQGELPCANPENYLFWDKIHPTAVTHQVIAQIVEEALQSS